MKDKLGPATQLSSSLTGVPGTSWQRDPAASGVRWRRRLPHGELLAYEDGRWEVRDDASNGSTVSMGKVATLDDAKKSAAWAYDNVNSVPFDLVRVGSGDIVGPEFQPPAPSEHVASAPLLGGPGTEPLRTLILRARVAAGTAWGPDDARDNEREVRRVLRECASELTDLAERARVLGAVADAAEDVLQRFGDEYEGRFVPLVEALKKAGRTIA